MEAVFTKEAALTMLEPSLKMSVLLLFVMILYSDWEYDVFLLWIRTSELSNAKLVSETYFQWKCQIWHCWQNGNIHAYNSEANMLFISQSFVQNGIIPIYPVIKRTLPCLTFTIKIEISFDKKLIFFASPSTLRRHNGL